MEGQLMGHQREFLEASFTVATASTSRQDLARTQAAALTLLRTLCSALSSELCLCCKFRELKWKRHPVPNIRKNSGSSSSFYKKALK